MSDIAERMAFYNTVRHCLEADDAEMARVFPDIEACAHRVAFDMISLANAIGCDLTDLPTIVDAYYPGEDVGADAVIGASAGNPFGFAYDAAGRPVK